MTISEDGKIRMMVIPIVAMLVVTMVVAGWQYEEEQEDHLYYSDPHRMR